MIKLAELSCIQPRNVNNLIIIVIQMQRIAMLDKHDPRLYLTDVKTKVALAVPTIAKVPNNSHSLLHITSIPSKSALVSTFKNLYYKS